MTLIVLLSRYMRPCVELRVLINPRAALAVGTESSAVTILSFPERPAQIGLAAFLFADPSHRSIHPLSHDGLLTSDVWCVAVRFTLY
jgi:hypothetical protein